MKRRRSSRRACWKSRCHSRNRAIRPASYPSKQVRRQPLHRRPAPRLLKVRLEPQEELRMQVVIARNWWSLVIRGLVGILFGIITFAWPGITFAALVIVFGAYALLDGVFSLVGAVKAAQA